MPKPRILTGYRPTGKLHLGHWFGNLQNMIALQREYQAFWFIADWHALTSHWQDPGHIRRHGRSHDGHDRAKAQRTDFHGCQGSHGGLCAVGYRLGFLGAVVRLNHALRLAAECLDQALALAVERAHPRIADNPLLVGAAALCQVLHDRLPLAEIGVHQPVDHLGHFTVDLRRHIQVLVSPLFARR